MMIKPPPLSMGQIATATGSAVKCPPQPTVSPPIWTQARLGFVSPLSGSHSGNQVATATFALGCPPLPSQARRDCVSPRDQLVFSPSCPGQQLIFYLLLDSNFSSYVEMYWTKFVATFTDLLTLSTGHLTTFGLTTVTSVTLPPLLTFVSQ